MEPVELWYARTDEVVDDELLDSCRAVLSDDERVRERAFVFAEHRHEYLVTRALCRGAIARAIHRRPSELVFRRDAFGRPHLEPAGALRFNLSNTTALVVCVLARGREIGVDTEPLARADKILELAPTVFTANERARLASLDPQERRRNAVALWTSKEAYMKARGMGLSIAPTTFEVDLDAPTNRLTLVGRDDDDPTRWAIETRIIEDHVVATCLERGVDASVPIAIHHADLRALLAT